MKTDQFDDLLAKLPKVAEAVNAFSSEEVQKIAFQTLMNALNPGLQATAPAAPAAMPPAPNSASATAASAAQERTKRRGKVQKKTVTAARNLDFRPAGKESLKDFANSKQPANNHERNVVAVHYLAEVLGQSPIDATHVVACYLECGWTPPADPANSLQVTTSTKNWLDTADMTNITLTPTGQSYVRHDLPKKAK
jgi:hypothetical protein